MDKSYLQCVSWSNHRDRLKEPITRIGNTANEPNLFNEIDKACSNEWAFLFVAPDGFVVLRPRSQMKYEYIQVCVASCHGGDAINRYLYHIIRLAKCGRASFIEFSTARKGFNKVAPAYGWRRFCVRDGLVVWRHFLEVCKA